MRSFLTVATGATVHQAARLLHLTPAAVHKHLRNLEQELQAPLLEKVGRRLRLTEAGELLLPYLREAVSQCAAARMALEEWKGLRRGLLRIGAGPTMSSYVLPRMLADFRQMHPEVDFLVRSGSTGTLLEELKSGALELAMVIAALGAEPPDMEVLGEWDFEIVMVTAMKGAPRACRLRSLKEFPFILYQPGSRIQAAIDQYFHQHRFDPKVIMRFDSAEAIKSMVRMGFGISMLPLWAVSTELAAAQIAVINQLEPPLTWRFALVGRRAARLSPAAQAFSDLARCSSGWCEGLLQLRHFRQPPP